LRTHAPCRRGDNDSQQKGEPRDVWIPRAAPVDKIERGCDDKGEKENENWKPAESVKPVNKKFGQPLVSDPRFPGKRERKRIGTRNGSGLGDPLTGPQVPPKVRVGNRAQGHQENPDEKQDDKNLAESDSHFDSDSHYT
jgi:hypothetical protein